MVPAGLVRGYPGAPAGFAFANQSSAQPLVGAIAGVLGAYLAIFPRAKVWSLVPFLFFIPLRIPAWLVLDLAVRAFSGPTQCPAHPRSP